MDFFIRDFEKFPHIVRFIGNTISAFEKLFRKVFKSDTGLLFSGFLIVFFNILIWGGAAYLIDTFLYNVNILLAFLLESFLFFQIFAKASLRFESMKVYHAIRSNGIVAPWFYATLGSIIAAFNTELIWLILVLPIIYKTVNTMDSMIGYKDEKYFYIGKAAARLDDIVNFLPARFSAIILLFVIFILSLAKGSFITFKNSLKAFIKYRYVHSSPNAGQTESIIAGFFDTKLLGDAYYFGKLVKKKSIGDGNTAVKADDIIEVNNIMYFAYTVLLIINLIIGGIICFIS